ncbi:MAG: Uma2 family endonuclease [Gemmatimonadaceae bacterium]|nr:Uma2 family endonuclease [Gemmatimonadaceae bacterium]
MPAVPTLPDREIWTVEDLDALPDDGNRYEVLYGELLVTSAPSHRHQNAATALSYLLFDWCRERTGFATLAFGGFHVDRTTFLLPDVALYAMDQHSGVPWPEVPPPVLAIEVLSPSTRKRDRHRKRPAYLQHGVRAVWLVDVDHRRVERWHTGAEFPVIEEESFRWSPQPDGPPIDIAFDTIFGPAVA